MNINEIKSWAKAKNLTVKKQGDGYIWFGDGVDAGEPACIEDVARAIFNRATDNRFVAYQKQYSEKGS
jgi:hypothetical protein